MLTNDTEVIQLVNQLTNQVETELNATIQFRDKFLNSSDSSSDSSTSSVTSDSDKETDTTKKKKVYRFKKTSNQVDVDSDDDESEPKQQTNVKYLKTKGELTIDDLQPVAKLSINLDDKIKLIKMGKVISIVDDKLVVVQSLINEQAKPLDEETVLFDSNRKCLGKIFEVFGPVTSPFYSIRFNNSKEIKENDLNVQKDEFIYYAPESEYTKFIFNVDDLRKVKGSDASWNNDNEPPVECLEYSDDEKEQQAKRLLKQQNRKVNENLDDDDSDVELIDGSDLSNKKAKMSNNSKTNNFNKSRSVGNFNREQNNRPNYNQRPQMSQSRSEFNFQPQPQPQHFYQPPPNHNYMQPPQQNQFYPYPPPPQPFSWQPNPNQQNPFMSYPPYYPPFMNYPPQQMRPQMPPQQMAPQFNNYDLNNNQRQSPAKVIDKRFVKNQNIVKKSF